MAVKIKLKRLGKIRAPYYRIVVTDARTKRDGRAIEEIGKYAPKEHPSYIEVNSERAQHWLSVGAQPTEPVRAIFEKTGDWQQFKGLTPPKPLQAPEVKPDKKTVFEAAAKEAQDSSESGSSGRSKSKKTDDKKSNAAKSEGAKGEDKGTAKTDSSGAEARSGSAAAQPQAESQDESAKSEG